MHKSDSSFRLFLQVVMISYFNRRVAKALPLPLTPSPNQGGGKVFSWHLCVFAVKKKQAPFINTAMITFSFILLTCSAYSQSKFTELKNPVEFQQQLSQATQKISTLTSNIIQEKNLSVISEKIITKGHFIFKKEKNLRWEYTQPFSYLIIFKDDKIFIKDEDKANQFDMRSNKLFREINDIMIGCIRGTILDENKKFSGAYFENNTLFLVKLHPLDNLKEFLKEIWIFFDKTDYTISKLEMYEYSGDFTKIVFIDKKLNTPVPDEKFSFN
jgi:outer membrane lipoprotein-sorting protein